MKITTRKVAIVGCGLVGSTTAFSLVTQGVCDEVMLIDINKERAYGEMLDMRDSIEYLNRNVKVKNGNLCRVRRYGYHCDHCRSAAKAGTDETGYAGDVGKNRKIHC